MEVIYVRFNVLNVDQTIVSVMGWWQSDDFIAIWNICMGRWWSFVVVGWTLCL